MIADGAWPHCRQSFASSGIVQIPYAWDGLSARAAELGGACGIYISCQAVAATIGIWDASLLTHTELEECVGRIAATTKLPIAVDARDGFGDAANVARVVDGLIDSGASAIELSDEVAGAAIVNSRDDIERAMVRKLRVASLVKAGRSISLVARTRFLGWEDLPSLVRRAQSYLNAGADVMFLDDLHEAGMLAGFWQALDDRPKCYRGPRRLVDPGLGGAVWVLDPAPLFAAVHCLVSSKQLATELPCSVADLEKLLSGVSQRSFPHTI